MDAGLCDGEPEDQVLSEVHIGCHPSLVSHISTFTIDEPGSDSARQSEDAEVQEPQQEQGPKLDENGDMVLARRKQRWQRCPDRQMLVINHRLATGLPRVGLQVWKGGLLLADFLLSNPECCHGEAVVELGAGTGVAGIVAGRAARTVFLTDTGTDVLDNCVRNVRLNADLFGYGGSDVRVRELDWLQPWPPLSGAPGPYAWTDADMQDAESAAVLLAADVIYSPEMTFAFFHLLEKLMPAGSSKVLYLAMEKRYNFSIRDCDVVANCYKEFRSCVCDESAVSDELQARLWRFRFSGEQVPVDLIPQTLAGYERGRDLELWRITRREHASSALAEAMSH